MDRVVLVRLQTLLLHLPPLVGVTITRNTALRIGVTTLPIAPRMAMLAAVAEFDRFSLDKYMPKVKKNRAKEQWDASH